MGSGEVQLTHDTVETLKFWDTRYPNIIMDRKYLKKLAYDVFGVDSLAISSVYGTHARNVNKKHDALDENKRKFIEGMYIVYTLYTILESEFNHY